MEECERMNKNEITRLTITGMTAEGNGVGRAENGMAVFVPMTAVDDVIDARIVKVNKSCCYGIIDSIITPSDDRVDDTGCKVYSKCGGCCFRHITYSSELKIKQKLVTDAFERIGHFDVSFFDDILGCEETDGYRNKAQYPITNADGKLCIGFFAARSHRIIPSSECALQNELFSSIASRTLELLEGHGLDAYDEQAHTGTLRHIYLRRGYHSGEVMLCVIARKDISGIVKGIASVITDEFDCVKSISVNINPDRTNVIMGKRTVTVSGSESITDIMCGNRITISPQSFYQVNTAQAERLYAIAKEYASLDGTQTVVDLYCGAGTIGLSMASDAKRIIGGEIIPQAIENARANASANGIANAEFICGDAKDITAELVKRGIKADVAVLDPPRKGCDEKTLEDVIEMSPERIVMISCNPATAARDVRFLADHGYSPVAGRAVDMFARTGHVETVVLLSKLQTKQHIDIELKTDELDLTASESKATYDEIKAYVKEHTGLSVSSLYIAQVKQKCGIIERENYNKAKSDDAKQPKCPKDKEAAIMDALMYFKMIK